MLTPKLYQKYFEEFRTLPESDRQGPEYFAAAFAPRLAELECVSDEQGELFYHLSDEGDRQVCGIPVYGYHAASDKALVRLFAALADRLVREKTTLFQVHLYAHDLPAQRQFALMQFGYMAETGLLKASLPASADVPAATIRTLETDEIRLRWAEIWAMTGSILTHLQRSPVFYPCTEFTEELYRDFFLDGDTRLHAAFDEGGRMLGLIETNSEQNALLRPDVPSANIGEIYVAEDRRGTGLSDALFRYALDFERKRGARYLWVEHGTANPQGRGFWGRYFESYEYEMDRLIERF